MTKDPKSALPNATGVPLTISEVAPPETPRKAPPAARKTGAGRRRGHNTPSLSIAVRAVEKRLVAAIRERDIAARDWAILNAKQAQAAAVWSSRSTEVNSLQNTISVLRGHQNPNATYLPVGAHPMMVAPAPAPVAGRQVTMEQVMSDQYIPPAQPAPQPPVQTLVPTTMQGGPQVPMPVVELPYIPGRGGGGAVGFGGAEPAQEIDEDEHLKSSAMAGGTWI